MIPDRNQHAFLALLKAGLWENDAQLLSYEGVDFSEVYKEMFNELLKFGEKYKHVNQWL